MSEREYFQVGVYPVKFVPRPDGTLAVLQLNLTTGEFELNVDRYHQINSARDGVEILTEDKFIDRVEATRARRLSGEGPVFALYELMNGIEDVARDEKRPLTAEEVALLKTLRRQSYALFQAEHPDPTEV
jgi:hypothetical protein